MKTKILLSSFSIIIIIGISMLVDSKLPAVNYQAKKSLVSYQNSGEQFFKTQCAFCHTSEELIAPDMNKIKAVYKAKYKTKEAFVKAVTAFVKNPDKKNAIYKDGIDNFTDMPKMPFKDAQIKATAEYIFSADKL